MIRKKKFDFFVAMAGMADKGLKASLVLDKIINNYDTAQLISQSTVIHQIEDDGDEDVKQIMHELYIAFITPIEREDIVQLVDKLDNIIDGISGLTYEFDYLQIQAMRPNTEKFIRLICDATAVVQQSVKEFARFKNSKILNDNIETINQLESQGDHLYTQNLRRLFAEESDPIEIIRWQKVYAGFEKVLDACEDCADVMAGLVIKNS